MVEDSRETQQPEDAPRPSRRRSPRRPAPDAESPDAPIAGIQPESEPSKPPARRRRTTRTRTEASADATPEAAAAAESGATADEQPRPTRREASSQVACRGRGDFGSLRRVGGPSSAAGRASRGGGRAAKASAQKASPKTVYRNHWGESGGVAGPSRSAGRAHWRRLLAASARTWGARVVRRTLQAPRESRRPGRNPSRKEASNRPARDADGAVAADSPRRTGRRSRNLRKPSCIRARRNSPTS